MCAALQISCKQMMNSLVTFALLSTIALYIILVIIRPLSSVADCCGPAEFIYIRPSVSDFLIMRCDASDKYTPIHYSLRSELFGEKIKAFGV